MAHPGSCDDGGCPSTKLECFLFRLQKLGGIAWDWFIFGGNAICWLCHRVCSQKRKHLSDVKLKDVALVRSDVLKGKAAISLFEWRASGIKVIGKKFSPKNEKRFRNELDVAETVSHKNIVEYYGKSEDPEGYKYLFMRYVDGGDLDQFINRLKADPRVQPQLVLVLTLQIAKAMSYIHETGFIHGDLKPSNIFVSSSKIRCLNSEFPHVEIGDFDRAQRTKSYSFGRINPAIFAAPELLRSTAGGTEVKLKHYPEGIDVYSFGIILYQLLSGESDLWKRLELTEADLETLRKEFLHDKIGLSLVTVIEGCLKHVPTDRPSFVNIYSRLEELHNELHEEPPRELQSGSSEASSSCRIILRE